MSDKKENAVAQTTTGGLALYEGLADIQLFAPNMHEYAMKLVDGARAMRSLNKMERIKVPSGGATTWELPAIDGTRAAKSFDAIIIASFLGRKYWENKNSKGTPPDCSSCDGIVGGFGECIHCDMDKFVQTDTGKRKPCQEFIRLIVITDDSTVPYQLTVPLMSMENLTRYIQRIASGGRDSEGNRVPPQMPHAVITRFSLEKVTSSSNNEYAKIVFKAVGSIGKENEEQMRELVDAYAPILRDLNEAAVSQPEDADS